MARKRNSDRFAAPTPQDTSPPVPTADQSPQGMFSFVTPTEFVDLPSEGRYYSEGHPLAGVDTIEIRHMTAKEEDILTSESLLKKGIAIDRLLESVIVDKNIKVSSLLIGDKNALLIASRITGFGPLYDTTVKCPLCTETNDKIFNLDELAANDVSEPPEYVTIKENGNFTFELPRSKVTVEVRLLTAHDEHILSQDAQKKKRLKLPDSRSTDLLKLVIVSINDHADAGDLHKFIDNMPLRDVKFLRKTYEQVKPDINITCDFICSHCSHAGEVVMPLTAQFFWPNA